MKITPAILYNWALENGAEDLPICLDVRGDDEYNEGSVYMQTDEVSIDEINTKFYINSEDTYTCVWLNGYNADIHYEGVME